MSSCQNNPSPSDPIDSGSRHFPPPSLSKSVSLLRNEMWRVRWTLSAATRLHRIRWSPLADISTSSSTQTCCKFSKTIANWHAASPMDSWHGNPSPSVPMESVCRHFPPLWLLYFVVYFLSLSRTNTPRYSCHGRPSPSDLMESCRLPTCISTQSATLYFAVYLISLSRTALRWVWLFMAFVHRTQFGCIGQHFKLLLFSG